MSASRAVLIAALLALACAAAPAEPWEAFEHPCTVLNIAPVVGPDGLVYLAHVACGRRVLRGETSVDFYLGVPRGSCVEVRGEVRGSEFRNVTMIYPCTKPEKPSGALS